MATDSDQAYATGPAFLRTLGLVFLAIVALFVIDTFLANVEKSESRAQATRLFNEGRRLAAQGRNAEAIDRLRSALSVSRGNRECQLALAGVLLTVRRMPDAEAVLNEILQNNPTDGPANLTMARVMTKEGKIPEATSYYHQSIYGRWRQGIFENRVKARIELIDLLIQQGAMREALSELLPLQDEAPTDIPTRQRIARLYFVAGSPSRASDIFRAILRQNPRDAEALAGLGEAEFATGSYRAARTRLLAASQLNPSDDRIRKRLAECEEILALDPTLRGLGSSERYRRSVKLVELALDAANRCAGAAPPKSVQDLASKARQASQRRVIASRREDETEANLELAEQLWQVREKECKQGSTQAEEPLAHIMSKLAQ